MRRSRASAVLAPRDWVVLKLRNNNCAVTNANIKTKVATKARPRNAKLRNHRQEVCEPRVENDNQCRLTPAK
eukprot:3195580-Alexandrium_andersonii.AAC.1